MAFGAALALRLTRLGLRPLHHDEGVNAWFLADLLAGRGYRYNPDGFHGPFLYFFGAPFAFLCGVSETALRLPVALVSAAMVPLLLPLRRHLGRWGITAAAWVLAVSPSLVFYGRDLIHETYLAAFTLALVVTTSNWLLSRRDRDLYFAAVCLSLLFTIKETAVLSVAGLAVAAVVAVATHGAGARDVWAQIHRARPEPGAAAVAALFAAVVYLLFFTSFGTHWGGLADSVRAYLPWVQKGVQGAGHEKPWTYFPELLLRWEPVAFAGALVGGFLAFRRGDPCGRFCAVWAASQLAVYSAIPYKTPWLMINLVVPATLATGFLFRDAAAWAPAWVRRSLLALFALGLTWSACRAVDVAFRRYDDARLGLVYSDSSRDVRHLVDFVRQAVRRAPPGHRVAVELYAGSRWPLPWYFRDLTVDYQKEIVGPPEGEILIVDRPQDERLHALLRGPWERREFTLRHGYPLIVYVKGELWRGAAPPTP